MGRDGSSVPPSVPAAALPTTRSCLSWCDICSILSACALRWNLPCLMKVRALRCRVTERLSNAEMRGSRCFRLGALEGAGRSFFSSEAIRFWLTFRVAVFSRPIFTTLPNSSICRPLSSSFRGIHFFCAANRPPPTPEKPLAEIGTGTGLYDEALNPCDAILAVGVRRVWAVGICGSLMAFSRAAICWRMSSACCALIFAASMFDALEMAGCAGVAGFVSHLLRFRVVVALDDAEPFEAL
mmetsp:Transcript_5515/g.10928  ORF Transcript_5515/g.10928 Transcript_5515/m.10928 type:complete len:240 (+) Transcript_5515:787-1506(+)